MGIVDDSSDIDLILVCRDEHYEPITSRFARAGLIPERSSLFVDVHLPSGKNRTLHPAQIIGAGAGAGEGATGLAVECIRLLYLS
ncbi:hypothetical protein ACFSQ7_45135 [Paenibacillus rhizoplanae]